MAMAAPATVWLMTAVGPPPWAITTPCPFPSSPARRRNVAGQSPGPQKLTSGAAGGARLWRGGAGRDSGSRETTLNPSRMFNRASQVYVLLVVAILGGAVVVRSLDPFLVQALRLIAFDSYQLLGPAKYDASLPVRIVDINEDSLGKIGQWPWARTTMADLLNKLTAQGAAVVAFDILFSEADRTSPEQAVKSMPADEAAIFTPLIAGKPTHDEAFAKALANAPAVLSMALSSRPTPPPPVKAGFAVAGDDPKAFVPGFPGGTANLPELDAAARGIGSINWIPDRDQVVRRVPLLYRVGDQLVPTLPMEALRVAQGASTYVVTVSYTHLT